MGEKILAFIKKINPKKAAILLAVVLGTAALTAGIAITAQKIHVRKHTLTVAEAYDLSVSKTDLKLHPGDRDKLEAIFTPHSEDDEYWASVEFATAKAIFSSSNEAVAKVDEDGGIIAVGPGKAVITASYTELSASCNIEVFIPIENIELLEHENTLNVGYSAHMEYKIIPENTTVGADTPVYTSSDTNIVTVDKNGRVTAVAPGTAEVTFTCGKFTDKCTYTVMAPMITVHFILKTKELMKEETAQAVVHFVPENTTDDRTVTWTSSDPAVATVDENGLITAVGPGDVEITGTCGRWTQTFPIHVTVPITGVYMYYQNLTLRLGETKALEAHYEPLDANVECIYEWESANPAVVTVDEQGVVTTVGPGTTDVTVSYKDFKSVCKITVIVPVTGVAISQGSMTLNKGESAGLSASCVPGNTTESPYITWSSDNVKVATVNDSGVVTAVGAGTANITANHDRVGASCVVTVYSPMTGISIVQQDVSIIKTFTAQLSVDFLPEDTTDAKNVTWSSDAPEIVTVSGDGTISALEEGEAVVTATCGSFTSSTRITVTPYIEVEALSISPTSHTFSAYGEKFKINAVTTPENASPAVTWKSSDPKVATVDAAGNVTAVGSGSATITASAGSCSADCTVSVPMKPKVVVLDPGHSGTFTGASYYGYLEDVINLKVAQYCKSYLESNYGGVQVYLTRSDRSPLAGSLGPDLEQRAIIAQNVGADILVSLHFNASVNHNASGCLAFISFQSNVASQSKALADQILARISALGLANLGTPQTASDTYFDDYGNPMDYYAINRHCANRGIPGIIVEHCFMDRDLAFYDSEEDLQRLGICDAQGIAAYLGLPSK